MAVTFCSLSLSQFLLALLKGCVVHEDLINVYLRQILFIKLFVSFCCLVFVYNVYGSLKIMRFQMFKLFSLL